MEFEPFIEYGLNRRLISLREAFSDIYTFYDTDELMYGSVNYACF